MLNCISTFKSFICILLLPLALQPTNAQILSSDTTKTSIFDKDLQELMNIPVINSASKKDESNIESPLSTTVITAEQIKNAGITTVEEVFRLVPGLIVREQSNGNFDVHIRGNDNIPPGGFSFMSANRFSLVMIDGRKVYNHMIGGTLWESLPITLTDIKQIEIIRGPATALYGPNAATGVINIITNNQYDKKVNIIGNIQSGSLNTSTANLTTASALNDKWTINTSVNYDRRNRGQETYYNYITGKYTSADSILDYLTFDPNNPTFQNPKGRWPEPGFSKEKLGINTQVTFDIGDSSNTSIATTFQESTAQAVLMESTATPHLTRFTRSGSIDYKLNLKNLHTQISYLNAVQDLSVGTKIESYKYNYEILDANLEYDYKFKNGVIRPGVQFQNVHFDDSKQTTETKKGILNQDRHINTFAYFLRADVSLTKKLRLVSALRIDHYTTPLADILSYQFILSYYLNKNNIIRTATSKANRGPFIADLFSDLRSAGFYFKGNPNLKLAKTYSYEIGYKAKLVKKLYLEAELFYNEIQGISNLSYAGINPQTREVELEWQNQILKTRQIGTTVQLSYAFNKSNKLTLFGTLQETKLINHLQPSQPNNILSPQDTVTIIHKNTPTYYGGAYFESKILNKLTFFTNLYFYSSQEYSYIITKNTIQEKVRMDAKIAYPIWKENTIFINGRNIFNNDTVEFGFADRIGSVYLIGLDLKI